MSNREINALRIRKALTRYAGKRREARDRRRWRLLDRMDQEIEVTMEAIVASALKYNDKPRHERILYRIVSQVSGGRLLWLVEEVEQEYRTFQRSPYPALSEETRFVAALDTEEEAEAWVSARSKAAWHGKM